MVSPEGWRLAEAHRQAQARIASAAVTDVRAAWPLLDMNRLDSSFPRYAGAVSALTQARRTAASGLGVMFYRNLRDLEAVSGKFNPLPAGPMDLEKLNTSLKVTGPVAVRSALARGASPAEAERIAIASTVGAVQSRIYDGGRGAVLRSMQADKQAHGYQRVSDGSPCAFCAMLVSRGAVYKSDASGGFKSHVKCGCSAVPFFELRPEQSAQAADMRRLWDATYDQGGYNGFRRAYERGPTAMIGPRASRARKSITKSAAVQDVLAKTVAVEVAPQVGYAAAMPRKEMSRDAAIAGTNPNEWTSASNCGPSVVACDMRMRGFDVIAGRVSDINGMHVKYLMQSAYEVPSSGRYPYDFVGSVSKAKAAVKAGGEGSRFLVMHAWKSGDGGHIYMAENIGGRVHFFDPQSNSSADCLAEYVARGIRKESVLVVRVDQLRPATETLTTLVHAAP